MDCAHQASFGLITSWTTFALVHRTEGCEGHGGDAKQHGCPGEERCFRVFVRDAPEPAR